MELKRILARDTRSATEKAMAMYGPDVLIISNHRVEGQTELIVALDVAEAAPEEMFFEMASEAQSQAASPVTVAATSPRARVSSTPSSVNNPFSDHLHQLLQPSAKMAQAEEVEPAAPTSTEQLLTKAATKCAAKKLCHWCAKNWPHCAKNFA
jgi:flagellar biosynthesis protein FlhF